MGEGVCVWGGGGGGGGKITIKSDKNLTTEIP